MAKSDSQPRIRQVAIVLTCVDAQTKQRLLGQLPSDQARLVRQEIARLGAVDPRERNEALKAFQSLAQSSGKSSTNSNHRAPLKSQGAPTSSKTNGRWPRSSERLESDYAESDSMNPASELLYEDIDSVHDQIEIDYPSRGRSSESQDDFEPVQTNSYEPFVTKSGWDSFPASSGADIARLLADERPTVVATVLKQVSTQLGAAILAALPSRAATLALSTLPNLDAVDKTITHDIHETIREKLSLFRSHLSPDTPDVQHIQSLLAIVPESKRRTLEQDLVVENSSLADSLGISLYGSSLRSENRSMDENGRPGIRAHDLIQNAQPSDLPVRDQPEGNDHDYDEQPRLNFDDLDDFSSDSLAMIFRESDPDTILIALTGAAIQLRMRLESMIAPNNLGRLRARFESLRTVGAESRLAARDEIARKANELVRSGRVSIPTLANKQLAS